MANRLPPRAFQHAVSILKTGIRAVRAENLLAAVDWPSYASRSLDAYRRIHVLGIGKAALAMVWAVRKELEGIAGERLVVAPRGYVASLPEPYTLSDGTRIIEAGHPVTDAAGIRAGQQALDIAARSEADDLVLVLLSGGGSALCAAFAPGIRLEDARRTTRLLLDSGADIAQINTVRKHISTFSGGQLARAAAPAEVLTLVISDVVGDDPAVIASGPTVPDATTYADAVAVLTRFDLMDRVPTSVRNHLQSGLNGALPENPGPEDDYWKRVRTECVGNNLRMLDTARQAAAVLGYSSYRMREPVTGEARDAGRRLIEQALEMRSDQPVALIWGGETTVTIRGKGLGGRNQEVALGAALALDGVSRPCVFLAAGSDGKDGPSPAAGAMASNETIRDARALGISAEGHLARNDAYTFFQKVGGSIVTGPTHTNVMDMMVALIYPTV